MEIHVGDGCLFLNADNVWVGGRVTEWDTSLRRGMCIEETYTARPVAPVSVGAADVKPFEPENDYAADNLIALKDPHPAHALHTLLQRFLSGRSHVAAGEVPILLNPVSMPRAATPYLPENMKHFLTSHYEGSDTMYPIWSKCIEAYDRMMASGMGQTLCCGGVRQAGQTETAKVMNRYFAFMSSLGAEFEDGEAPPSECPDTPAGSSLVGHANLILECFGNARVDADAPNSSRYHRVTSHHFDTKSGGLAYSQISTYFLEVERVVFLKTLHEGEESSARSFHAFYALLQDGEKCTRFALQPEITAYENLRKGAAHNRDFSSAEELAEVENSLEVCGFDTDAQVCMWSSLAAILHLQKATPDVDAAAVCIGVDPLVLRSHLSLGGVMDVNNEHSTANLHHDKIDAFCKALFASLFEHIVATINDTLRDELLIPTETDTTPIHVVDLSGIAYGTQKFSLGSLRLNTATEVLWKETFNRTQFQNHIEECMREGVKLATPGFYENTTNVKVLGNYLNGVLQICYQSFTPKDAVSLMRRQYYNKSAAPEGFSVRRETHARSQFDPMFYIDDADGDVDPDLAGPPVGFHFNHFCAPHYTRYSLADSDCYRGDATEFDDIFMSSEVGFFVALPPAALCRSAKGFNDTLVAFKKRFLTASGKVDEVGAVHFVLCAATALGWEGYDQTYVGQQLLFLHNFSALLQMQKHGFPVRFSRREFANLFGAPVLRHTQLFKYTLRPVMNIFAPDTPKEISPTRRKRFQEKQHLTPHETLEEYGVGLPYDAQIGSDGVFLKSHVHRRMLQKRSECLLGCAEVVTAFCRAYVANTHTTKAKVREAKPDLVESMKDQIRLQARLAADLIQHEADEPPARAAIEEDQVWDLLDIAGNFAHAFFDVYMQELVRKDTEYRPFIEEDEATAFRDILYEYLGVSLILNEGNEIIERAAILEEEITALDTLFYDNFWEQYAGMQRQREEDEEAEEREMHEVLQAYDRATLETECLEKLKPYTIRQEALTRGDIIRAEAEEWEDLHAELQFMYLDVFGEDLCLEEELGRYGYRGVGGILVEEAESWKKLCRDMAESGAFLLASETIHRQPGMEQTARNDIEEQQRVAFLHLRCDYINQSAPHKVHAIYTKHHAGREFLLAEEHAAVKQILSLFYDDKIFLLLGRSRESEVVSRKMVEKMQRDAKRRLVGKWRRMFVQVEEEKHREVMHAVDEVQRQELDYRRHAATREIQQRLELRVRFEVEKKHWLALHRNNTADRMERDARALELTRRHYLQLEQAKYNTERLNRQTSLAAAQSLEHLHTNQIQPPHRDFLR